MLEIKKNLDLTKYTSLKVGDKAKYFVIVKDKDDLIKALFFAKENNLKVFILGGGTNTLITKALNCLVIKNEIKGLNLIKETKNYSYVLANSGETWSRLVDFVINKNLGGLENLYYVPGTVGAAPIQNIGAYGKELKDNFFSLLAYDLKTGKYKEFSKKDCQFGYRDSVFKNKYKDRFFIISIIVKLDKKPKLVLNYGQVKERLLELGIKKPSILQVAKIIKKIRDEKLPNPAVLPNAGSFFKNPIIKENHFKKLVKDYPNIPNFKTNQKKLIKVPAAWLIEKSGFKGKKFKSVGMYEKQALILVNYDKAKAKDVLSLVKRIKNKVYKKFQIKLEEEVNIL
jgi:UDP-N-acetylmuramate dehydrogenase